jgi:hypothetical protein
MRSLESRREGTDTPFSSVGSRISKLERQWHDGESSVVQDGTRIEKQAGAERFVQLKACPEHFSYFGCHSASQCSLQHVSRHCVFDNSQSARHRKH